MIYFWECTAYNYTSSASSVSELSRLRISPKNHSLFVLSFLHVQFVFIMAEQDLLSMAKFTPISIPNVHATQVCLWSLSLLYQNEGLAGVAPPIPLLVWHWLKPVKICNLYPSEIIHSDKKSLNQSGESMCTVLHRTLLAEWTGMAKYVITWSSWHYGSPTASSLTGYIIGYFSVTLMEISIV